MAALQSEARCILRGQNGQRDRAPRLLVRASGIGGERAARSAGQLLEAGAAALLCFGVAGALDPALRCGDVVLATEVLGGAEAPGAASRGGAELARIGTCVEWRESLAARLHAFARVHIGALLTSDELVSSAQRKQQLFGHSGAIAVDMESAAVGAIAQRHGLPFLALRVIADTAQDSLPDVLHSALAGGAAQARGVSFWWSLLSAPRSWAALARLGRRYRCARTVLAGCARAGVGWTPRSEAALST